MLSHHHQHHTHNTHSNLNHNHPHRPPLLPDTPSPFILHNQPQSLPSSPSKPLLPDYLSTTINNNNNNNNNNDDQQIDQHIPNLSVVSADLSSDIENHSSHSFQSQSLPDPRHNEINLNDIEEQNRQAELQQLLLEMDDNISNESFEQQQQPQQQQPPSTSSHLLNHILDHSPIHTADNQEQTQNLVYQQQYSLTSPPQTHLQSPQAHVAISSPISTPYSINHSHSNDYRPSPHSSPIVQELSLQDMDHPQNESPQPHLDQILHLPHHEENEDGDNEFKRLLNEMDHQQELEFSPDHSADFDRDHDSILHNDQLNHSLPSNHLPDPMSSGIRQRDVSYLGRSIGDSNQKVAQQLQQQYENALKELQEQYNQNLGNMQKIEREKYLTLQTQFNTLQNELDSLRSSNHQLSQLRSAMEQEKELDILNLRREILSQKEKQLKEMRKEFNMEKEELANRYKDELSFREKEFESTRKRLLDDLDKFKNQLEERNREICSLKQQSQMKPLTNDFSQQFSPPPAVASLNMNQLFISESSSLNPDKIKADLIRLIKDWNGITTPHTELTISEIIEILHGQIDYDNHILTKLKADMKSQQSKIKDLTESLDETTCQIQQLSDENKQLRSTQSSHLDRIQTLESQIAVEQASKNQLIESHAKELKTSTENVKSQYTKAYDVALTKLKTEFGKEVEKVESRFKQRFDTEVQARMKEVEDKWRNEVKLTETNMQEQVNRVESEKEELSRQEKEKVAEYEVGFIDIETRISNNPWNFSLHVLTFTSLIFTLWHRLSSLMSRQLSLN
ncbi:hypothetical protein BKA69DRAFT_1138989 [Paraphysoderma sedebokerense]|nr:hypothetical protein BKA69DRAFT_1138989 [Paraphysoderma sedebokerense]